MSVVQISEFTKKVIIQIHKIPSGKVATYKQIAELAGKPHGSRGVAWILHTCSTKYKLPWHRVLNSKGQISFDKRSSHFVLQKRRLEKEGVQFVAAGQLSLAQFQWKKRPAKAKAKRGKPQIFS
jgi:methylated-DNA-protein-cysteine methyltransferase-like protein